MKMYLCLCIITWIVSVFVVFVVIVAFMFLFVWAFVGVCMIQTDITKTYLNYFDPLKLHFYIVKLGFTGVYIIFLISAQNIDFGYSLELPHQGSSNKYPQSRFWAEMMRQF